MIKTLPLFPCAKRNSSSRTTTAAETRKDRAEQSGLSVCPWSPVPWISGAHGKAEAARTGFSCVLLCNLKWQHKSFLHYSLRIMLIHNGRNVTSSLFTYEAKTCHGSILTVGIVGEVQCSHSQLGLIRLVQNEGAFSWHLLVCFHPNILSGTAEKSVREKCSNTGFQKVIVRTLNGKR